MILSIVIPVYNVEPYVERCIRSCAEQQNVNSKDYEIIVINDGTKDRSAEIATSVAREYPNITVYHQENQGLSAARNRGKDLASGEYVWFVDSDDWIAPDSVYTIIKAVAQARLDILRVGVMEVYEDYEEVISMPFEASLIMKGAEVWPKMISIAPVQFSIYRMDWLNCHNLHFYVGIYHEDTEFTPRAYWWAESVGFSDKTLYYYFKQNTSSITKVSTPKRSYDLLKVCDSLSSFSTIVKGKDANYYNALNKSISVTLNSAFNNMLAQTKDEKAKFNAEMSKHRYLLKHLLLSGKPKYLLEWILFCLTNRYTVVYDSLQMFKI